MQKYFLEKAKFCGDYLVVALEPDAAILQNKQRYPLYAQHQRAHNLTALCCVDTVLCLPPLKGFQEYAQLVKDVHPHVIALTAQDPQTENKRKQIQAIGGTLAIVTERIGHLSSTRIAEKWGVERALGVYTGVVTRGLQEGRTLGYPTANLSLSQSLLPKSGVYGCDIWVKNRKYKGMCYYDAKRSRILESHLLNYSGDLYGQEITVILKTYIRAPQKVLCVEELQALLQKDAQACLGC